MKKIAAFVLVIVLLLAFTLIVSASSSYTSRDVSATFDLLDTQDKQIIYAPLVQQILDLSSERTPLKRMAKAIWPLMSSSI